MNRLILHAKRLLAAWTDRPLRSGAVVGGRYRLDEPLGIGSYGLTYRATDLLSGRPAALKQAKPSKGEAARELLRREAAMLERLDHPAIPRALSLLEERGQLYLASELAPGETLEDLLFEHGRTFTETEALRLVRSLADIVGHVHDRGCVHLDVRIPNVMFNGEFEAHTSAAQVGFASGDSEAHTSAAQVGFASGEFEAHTSAAQVGFASGEFEAHTSAAQVGFASGERLSLIDFGLARRIGEPPLAAAPASEDDRRNAPAEPASDLLDLGHLLLFLLYSSYVPEPGAPDRGWEDELEPAFDTRRLLRRLLGSKGPPLGGVPELLTELDRMLAARRAVQVRDDRHR
ncbi:protein kinase [Paenibacillus albicereus]|uniref:non-specific serine/threonine protein kinase n=1 Tax=Paenibacillus albicereus TaxID=2726185 RepID=A0A6H2GVS1_9BACL|nr:protein kinase [Paenibacillus albicereus]QJC51524.1 protein kinase [Paenibacillus albicereus]